MARAPAINVAVSGKERVYNILRLHSTLVHSLRVMCEHDCDVRVCEWGTHNGDSTLQLPLTTLANHMFVCAIYFFLYHSTLSHAHLKTHKVALSQRNFVAPVMVRGA
jgi:hypothetical protein